MATILKDTIRVGCGAGQSDDRLPPAADLASYGNLDYLVFECLAERTIGRETQSKIDNPEMGYTPSLHDRFRAVLPICQEKNIRIVSNMGAANPLAAARAMRREALDLGLGDIPSAVVLGDDVTEIIRNKPDLSLIETGEPLEAILPRLISANAYLGADVVAQAIGTGAPVVLTGRVADPSLFLAPMLYEFGWSYEDLDKLAIGTITGHLLECSSSLTGGCFSWPGRKEVPNLADLGYPLAEITKNGNVRIEKTPGSGGRLDVMTCTEQLLYEMHDPEEYITPDCILDISDVELVQQGRDEVAVLGAKARRRTDTYKVVVGYTDGYIGEGEVSFGGIDAVARANMAADLVKERLNKQGFTYEDYRVDLIGMSSLHGSPDTRIEPYEVRLRVAGRSQSRKAAEAVGFEVRSMHMHGPGGAGGGKGPFVREVLAVRSVLLPRELVSTSIVIEGAL
ncbi:MAG: hypothetical protein CMM58_14775 [Rhodospirillaceae bacterium]|nr:hypothetical protein [Rhodospirillaceae bacterium]